MGTDLIHSATLCPLPRTAKCAACGGRGWKFNTDYSADTLQVDCAACGTTGRVAIAGSCRYRIHGMTGLQELDALERHLQRCHPTNRESAMVLRDRAEHIASSCAGI